MKNLNVIFLLMTIHLNMNGQGNDIYIEGKNFMLNGNIFTPVVMNYGIEVSGPNPLLSNFGASFITPYVEYGINSNAFNCSKPYNFECATTGDCLDDIQEHFNYIVGMGFNTIRIAHLYPRFRRDANPTLTIPFRDQNILGCEMSLEKYPFDVNNYPNDVALNHFLNFYDQILILANSTINPVTNTSQPIRIIFNTVGTESDYQMDEVLLYKSFMEILSAHLSNSIHKHLIFAYDVFNEPCYHDKLWPPRSKGDACEIVESWYNALKSPDPNRLITLGSCGIKETSYDMSALKLDFISYHTYPEFGPSAIESISNPNDQLRVRKRLINELKLLDRICPTPWIIGETGFSAYNLNTITPDVQGLLSDQYQFAEEIMNNTFNCGGSGFSWWHFQDGFYQNSSNDVGRYYGLLYWNAPLSALGEKPAVNFFRTYQPNQSNCEDDYTPIFDHTTIYYDTYQASSYNSTFTNSISGIITNQFNEPIPDCNILGWTYTESELPPLQGHFGYYQKTYSDINGFYNLIPYNFVTPSDNRITFIRFTLPGGNNQEFGLRSGNQHLSNFNGNLMDTQIKFQYNSLIQGSNHNVLNGQNINFSAYNQLEIKDVTLAGESNLKARVSIALLNEIDITNNSEVHIYCEETFPVCQPLLIVSGKPTASGELIAEGFSNSKLILSFKKEQGFKLVPNPSNGLFKITALAPLEDKELVTLEIFNNYGQIVLSKILKEDNNNINLSSMAKGLYFARIVSKRGNQLEKIVIN
jgi:hypothetical protein